MNELTNKELLDIIIKNGSDIDIGESVELKEIAKRMLKPKTNEIITFDRPQTIADWLHFEIGESNQEHFMAIYLDKQNRLIDYKILFTGTLDRSVVHPRDIFREGVKLNSSRIIIAHNHPSSSLTPSKADIKTTEVLIEVGKMMGIYILDHLIIARGKGYTSIRENHPYLFITD